MVGQATSIFRSRSAVSGFVPIELALSFVIASEAKQSSFGHIVQLQSQKLDCRVAFGSSQ